MCGIVGKINLDQSPVSEKEIALMTEKISHRGPDADGLYVKDNIGLGHRRLSIIDLSETGSQPMNDSEKNIWITFNGEIYNYLELKKDLEDKYDFKSSSDTEVIIYLYKEYGVDCLKYLRGMFAFAIWDEKKQLLFCARDRLGQKPFKYYMDDKKFVFASELKAILTQEVKPELDWEAISHYLSMQYCPTPLTGFKNIKKLPPASYLILKDGKIEINKYWEIDYSKKQTLSEDEWKKKILAKLNESTKLRMRADVEVGAFLSGGVDSSAVVHFMAQNSDKPINTFSVGFDEEEFNELPQAKLIADKYKTNHHELKVDTSNLEELIPKLVELYEEPYADSSMIPTYLISEITNQKIKVVLNGDGGDENFTGYPRYKYLLKEKYLPKINWPFNKNTFGYRLQRLMSKEGYYKYFAYFTDAEKNKLFNKELISSNEKFDVRGNNLDDYFKADLNTYLLDDLLVKVDIASMGVGAIELRSPFLDYEFMELTAQIPAKLKPNKYILKQSLKGILPEEILFGKKRGFSIPMLKWMKEDLNKFAKKTIDSGYLLKNDLMNREELEKLYNNLDNHNNLYDAYKVWTLMLLELWLAKYF